MKKSDVATADPRGVEIGECEECKKHEYEDPQCPFCGHQCNQHPGDPDFMVCGMCGQVYEWRSEEVE